MQKAEQHDPFTSLAQFGLTCRLVFIITASLTRTTLVTLLVIKFTLVVSRGVVWAADSSPARSASQAKREQKRRPKPKDGTVLFCGVCGDRALGYNFDAISCESCKAFFRRNALKAKPFTCSFEGNCKLDAHTRKFCSGCRLKKCFTIGMKKEWILNEDQLVKRRQRQQTRQLHGPSSNPDIQPCSSTSSDLIGDDASLPPYIHQGGRHSVSHLMPAGPCQSNSDFMPLTPGSYFDSHSSASTSPMKRQYSVSFEGSTSPTSTTSPPIPYLHQQPASLALIPTADAVAKIPKLEYTSDDDESYYRSKSVDIQEMVGSSDDLSNGSIVKEEYMDEKEDYMNPLNPQIDSNLRELEKVYNEIFEAPYMPEQLPKLIEKPKTANQLFNMTDIFIRRLIRFAKHIPEFKNLTQADQIHLLKGGIMEIFYLRSAISFDAKNSGWKFKMQQMYAPQVPKEQEGKVDSSIINNVSSSMFMHHMSFVHQLQELSKKDRIVLMLLFIIELMSPSRPHLVNVRQVSISQERHSMWLKAYLESVNTVAEAKVIYQELLLKLQDVRSLGKESCEMAAQLDITNLEPLLVEVFDLNR
ncbi:hypothetical protein Btru_027816 [Bulinus truncatus]|nr:hypothetical protein Btru_027816 [Bulinus truncatus]